ncbi:MAG TPA: hypothetical protein VN688_02245 [Gemmataceae bacterium]|nr:hypothetical protein [Gemmataceae bacterium]
MTNQGRLARACRLVVKVELFDRVKGRFSQEAILDTGAPFSVFPYTVWNINNLSWTPLGSQLLTPQGQVDPEATKWLGVSCELGVIQIALLDETLQRTRSLRAIAKFPLSAPPGRFKQDIILGYHFLMDNTITLTVNPASRATAGNLANVVGFLTIR